MTAQGDGHTAGRAEAMRKAHLACVQIKDLNHETSETFRLATEAADNIIIALYAPALPATSMPAFEAMKGALRRIEWAGHRYGVSEVCPCCEGVRPAHENHCALRAALAASGGE